MQLLSIVIPNYNYEMFLAAAVRSALAIDWPDVEVIVVDDGSTDRSLEVLEQFGNRITVLTQENQGPRSACNYGFAHSSGDAIVFLDSDDMVEPGLAREVANVWRPRISKVQVQMQRVDESGVPRGQAFPRFRFVPSPQQVRAWMASTSAYPTPPGSGNVYSREFLDSLFPLDDRCGDATDSACLAAAPFLGDVLTVPLPLVKYRVHANNRSRLNSDPLRFRRQIERAIQRNAYACDITGHKCEASHLRPLRRGRHLLQMRAANSRLSASEPPIPGDTRWQIAWDSIFGIVAPGPESALHRLATTGWCLLTLSSPLVVSRWLIAWRFH